jgi:hypothetical protein
MPAISSLDTRVGGPALRMQATLRERPAFKKPPRCDRYSVIDPHVVAGKARCARASAFSGCPHKQGANARGDLRCEAFLTVERRLPRNAGHIERELGIRILTPITHWEMLEPWAALWR